MTRLRLATLLMTLMALSGPAAMPSRQTDLLRPAHVVSWWRASRRQSRIRRPRAAFVALVRRVVIAARPPKATPRNVALPYSLFQRPPPLVL